MASNSGSSTDECEPTNHDLMRRGPLGAVGNRVGAILQCTRCMYVAPGVDMVDLDARCVGCGEDCGGRCQHG